MVSKNKYYMYVLYCADDTLYCGFTTNVAHRLAMHETGRGAKYTRVKSRHPLRLIYQMAFDNKHAALSAEYRFKHQPRAKKVAYLAARGIDVARFYYQNHSHQRN
ncbi:GIY-YIG nuclease family protein [Limosilactobacillus sp.]|uniref:GIY-YIG nuclease family protein n=1 Tax=Limosilactobacillus sp. TaxID=2773925 RepID=UPI003F10A2AC